MQQGLVKAFQAAAWQTSCCCSRSKKSRITASLLCLSACVGIRLNHRATNAIVSNLPCACLNSKLPAGCRQHLHASLGQCCLAVWPDLPFNQRVVVLCRSLTELDCTPLWEGCKLHWPLASRACQPYAAAVLMIQASKQALRGTYR